MLHYVVSAARDAGVTEHPTVTCSRLQRQPAHQLLSTGLRRHNDHHHSKPTIAERIINITTAAVLHGTPTFNAEFCTEFCAEFCTFWNQSTHTAKTGARQSRGRERRESPAVLSF